MAILVGIDEAGYGPLLGPLVVSATAFSLADNLLGEDMWGILSSSIGKNKKNLRGRILITDSKKAYDRKAGLGHLQRTALTMLRVLGFAPTNLGQLLSLLCPALLERLQSYAWYKSLDKVDIYPQNDDIAIAANAFKIEASQKGVGLIDIKSEVLDVGYYNDMVEKVHNKSSALFTSVCKHLQWALDHFGKEKLHIIVDKQGGKSHYLASLALMFPQMEVKILREGENDSSYELFNEGSKAKIHFMTKADERFLPVSLASMISKYLRELMIERINDYFLTLSQRAKPPAKQVKPTAGYWSDGQRFISEIEEIIAEQKIDKNLLIRTR